ncbi:hypothetical protein Pfo_028918 [Paulownia fortunei]|nr:hypothetical protein Pfo_028918 [Paulownia fortunei]
MPPTPPNFPFTIEDTPGSNNIILARKLAGEKIDVYVNMPWDITEEDDKQENDLSSTDVSDDESDDDNGGGADSSSTTDSSNEEEEEESSADPSPHIMLDVIIGKEIGTFTMLSLRVSASADTMKIITMRLDELPDPDAEFQICGQCFVDPDSDLQFALRKFLEIRGIKKTNFGFLFKYMVRKSKRDPMLVLKKLKMFIKE